MWPQIIHVSRSSRELRSEKSASSTGTVPGKSSGKSSASDNVDDSSNYSEAGASSAKREYENEFHGCCGAGATYVLLTYRSVKNVNVDCGSTSASGAVARHGYANSVDSECCGAASSVSS